MKGFEKKSVVTFNKSGSGSKSGRVTIPADWLKFLDIKDSEEERNISITLVDDQIIIKKYSK